MARPVLKTSPVQKASIGGLIVVALLIVAVTVIILGGEKGFLARRYELKARFTRISGLQSGAPVWLAGQKVGYVSSVEFVRNTGDSVYIDVAMRIDEDISDLIRSDSKARIGTLGLLGDKFVGITFGSPDSAQLRPGDYVETDSPIDFEELIGRGVETFNDLAEGGKSLKSIAAKLDTGQGTLGKLINNPEMFFDLMKLAKYSQQIAGKIERNEGTIGHLFNEDGLYEEMLASIKRVQDFVDSVKMGSGSIGRFVRDPSFYDHLTATLGKIDTLVARVERGEGTTGKLISNDELYQNLNGAVGALDSLLTDIRRNPEGFLKVKVTIF